MIDGIIKGDGTSRLARSVQNFKTLYPTYDAFVEALVGGTLPLDVLFNADGWDQKPDFLNKASLLKDSTAALFKGLPDNPVPDDVFKVLSKAAIVTEGGLSTPSGGEVPGLVTVYGTYIGTGAQSVTLNFRFRPDVVLVGGPGDSKKGVITLLRGTTQNQIMGSLNAYCFSFPNVSWGETSVTWSGSATVGLKANTSGQTYRYWALGVKQ